MGTLSLAIVSISISIAIGDGTETRSKMMAALLKLLVCYQCISYKTLLCVLLQDILYILH